MLITKDILSEINSLIAEHRTLVGWLATERYAQAEPQYIDVALKTGGSYMRERTLIPVDWIRAILDEQRAEKQARLAAVTRRLNQLNVSLDARKGY